MTDKLERSVDRYEAVELTLGQAARLAGVDRWTMRDVLRERGVEVRIGLEDEEDAEYEVEQAHDLRTDDT